MSQEICIAPAAIADVTLQLRNWAMRLAAGFVAPEPSGDSQVLKEYTRVAKQLFEALEQYSMLLQWDARRIDDIATQMAGIDRSLASGFHPIPKASPAMFGPNSDLAEGSPLGANPLVAASPQGK